MALTLDPEIERVLAPMADVPSLPVGDAPHAVWSYDDNATGWGALLGDAVGSDDVSPYAAPGRAADLSGLPPTYLEVGQLDIFRDEDMTYALRLGRAGVDVDVEFHLRPGAPHEFDTYAWDTDVGRRAVADRVRVLAALGHVART